MRYLFLLCLFTQAFCADHVKNFPPDLLRRLPNMIIHEGKADEGHSWRIHTSTDATEKQPHKLLVWLHGTGGSGNEYIEPHAPFFADAGYALLVFEKEKYHSWKIDQLQATLTDVGKLKHINADRPVLMGYSLGGQIALRLWKRKPEAYGG